MPQQRDPEDKRRRILDAAIPAFQNQGSGATRISDIAEAAGVGKGTVYEYWRSKEELLLACCLRVCQRDEERIYDLIGTDQLEDMHALQEHAKHPVKASHMVLHMVLRVVLQHSSDEQRLFMDLKNLACTHPEFAERVQTEIGSKLDSWRRLSQALYEAGRDAGYFRELPNPDQAAHFIVAAVDGLIYQQNWNVQEDPENLARQMADTWAHLLMKEPHRLEEYLA